MIDGVRGGLLALVCVIACATLVGCASRPDRGLDASEYARDRTRRLVEAQRLAEQAERTDDPAKAEELLREAVRLFPQHSAYWTNLGTALAQQNDFGGASEAYGVAADLDPTDPRPLYNIGTLWAKRYYPREASEYYERALDRDPNYLNAMRGLVRVRSAYLDYDREVLEVVDRAIILEKDDEWRRFFQRQRNVIQGALDEGDGALER